MYKKLYEEEHKLRSSNPVAHDVATGFCSLCHFDFVLTKSSTSYYFQNCSANFSLLGFTFLT